MNVTYLLGAGASAQSLPVVSNMKDRFSLFNDFIIRYVDIPNKNTVHDMIKHLLGQIKSHASVDTFAKKLHLQENFKSTAKGELFLLKHYLSLFFIAEQSAFYKSYRTESGSMPAPFPIIDSRYDPFLATLLQKKGRKVLLPEDVNIISWNYDYQLESAYTAFAQCKLNEALALFNEIPTIPPPDLGGGIVKLNGVAGMYFEKDEKTLVHLLSNGKEEFDINDFKNLLESFANMKPTLLIDDYEKYLQPFINFAWENSPFERNNADELKKILSETRILVIIGYSFPNFNRLIDRQIFNRFINLDKIYYQADIKHLSSLIVRLRESIIKHGGGVNENIPIIEYTDTDQFCIPYEL